MDQNLFVVLALVAVIGTLKDAIMSRAHTRADAVGLVRTTIADLVSRGFLPNFSQGIADPLIISCLEANPEIKLDSVIPDPVDTKLTERVTAAEASLKASDALNIQEESRLASLENSQAQTVVTLQNVNNALQVLADAVAKLTPAQQFQR